MNINWEKWSAASKASVLAAKRAVEAGVSTEAEVSFLLRRCKVETRLGALIILKDEGVI